MRTFDVVEHARRFLYVRELPNNHGLRVEAIQHWSGGAYGDSWCAEFVWFVFDACYQGNNPLPRTGATAIMLEACHAAGWIATDPQPSDLAFSVNPDGSPHHVAILTGVNPLTAIAGNTSPDGLSSNGDGVYEHPIASTAKVFARIP